VPGSVTVPMDQLAADFDFTAGATAAMATVTASLDATVRMAAVDVVEGSTAPLVINEVDYDQPGTDMAEYVELYNRSGGVLDLSGIELVFINGSGGTEYRARISLMGTLAAGGYLVVANPGVMVDPAATVIRFSTADNSIQNGAPDGLLLWDGASGTIMDALSYEGAITGVTIDGMSGLSLVEGTMTAASDSADGSLSRIPNGTDTDDASADWAFTTTLTPGTANAP